MLVFDFRMGFVVLSGGFGSRCYVVVLVSLVLVVVEGCGG